MNRTSPSIREAKLHTDLSVRWRGRINFAEALAQQERLVERKWLEPGIAEELWLLEHDPVYTIGRTPNRSSLLGVTHLSHPLFEINRGGQATYHGPGQLVGYFFIDLRQYGQDLHRYLRWLEMILVELLALYGLDAVTRPALTGVWVDDRKIASIGVGVRHWITMHGFALNVCGDLAPFDQITPCGISGVKMTSLEKETDKVHRLEQVAAALGEIARSRLDQLRSASDFRHRGAARTNVPC
jgi:lipoyl(octanoyl) transferase